MKTNKIYSILSIFIIVFTLNSCIQDGDFTLPNITVEEPNIIPNSNITAVKSALQQEFNSNNNLIYTFPVNEGSPTYFEGYVVSSDATGNFYKRLIIQDAIENPTAGIELLVNKTSLNEMYDVGRKLYVKIDGLTVSYDDGDRNIDPTNNIAGKYVLGNLEGDRVRAIPTTSIDDHIFRTGTVEEIVPTIVSVNDFTGAHVNTLIKLSSAQFDKSQLGKTFAGEPNDEFDGLRDLFECDTEKILKLQTSTFASFKSNVLPEGKGSITAVLSKDFRSEFFVAIINTPSDIMFTEVERCDPPVLECGNASVGGSNILFNGDFETISNFSSAGWTNVNVSGGTNVYSLRSFSGNKYAQMSAFRTGENPLEAWLVTPAINLDNSTDEELTFDTKTGFNNGRALAVFVSTDFSGDVTTATWLRVDATIADGPSSGYQSNFTSSGSVNLSCLSGNVYVAFRYLGGDGDITTTFQIDNVKVTGN